MFHLLRFTGRETSEYLQRKIERRESYGLMYGIDYREIINIWNSAYEKNNPTKKRLNG